MAGASSTAAGNLAGFSLIFKPNFYLPMIYELNIGAEFNASKPIKINNYIEDSPLNKFN